MSDIRLIDANALKEVAKTKFGNDITSITVLKLFEELIDNAPTVDAIVNTIEVRPQGYYIGRLYFRPSTKQYDCQMYMCSECGEEYSYDAETGIGITDYSFCPKCGAKMNGGTEWTTTKR